MNQLIRQPAPLDTRADLAARPLARRLATAGMGVEVSLHQDTCQLTILGGVTGKACVALEGGGLARWYYEPAAGPGSDPAALTAIIAYLLGEPPIAASTAPYRALPLKGQVGRSLQDRGLAVALRVSEDWDSFEATTDIGITSPTRPWLGTITLSDDAALEWRLDWRTAFRENPAVLIDLITPILRPRR